MEALKTISAAKGTPLTTILAVNETMLLKLRLHAAFRHEDTRKHPGTEFARIYHGYEVDGLDGRIAMASLKPHVELLGSGLFFGDAPTKTKTIDPNLGQNLDQGAQAGYGGLPSQVQDGLETDADGLNGVDDVQNDSGGTSAATPANTTAGQIPAVDTYNVPIDPFQDFLVVGGPQPETVNPADLML